MGKKKEMHAIACKIESQCDKETWFPMGEICPDVARLWNDHHSDNRNRLFVVERRHSQCAYVHHGPKSTLPMICNGVVFGAKWCQFLKHDKSLYVVLRLKRGAWNFPQSTLQIDDEVNDRVINYNKLGQEFLVSLSDPVFNQSLEIIAPLTIAGYKLKKETKFLISKHVIQRLPVIGSFERLVPLSLHPCHCSFSEWMEAKPWDIVRQVWFMVYCCYKKTNWHGMQHDFFGELQYMSSMEIRLSAPSCLEVSPQRLKQKCEKYPCRADDKMQNTQAHEHATSKSNLNGGFDPVLWFRRNKYGMLPIHTAILFHNSQFVECFLSSTFAKHDNKLMFRFANTCDVNVEQFQNIVSNTTLNFLKYRHGRYFKETQRLTDTRKEDKKKTFFFCKVAKDNSKGKSNQIKKKGIIMAAMCLPFLGTVYAVYCGKYQGKNICESGPPRAVFDNSTFLCKVVKNCNHPRDFMATTEPMALLASSNLHLSPSLTTLCSMTTTQLSMWALNITTAFVQALKFAVVMAVVIIVALFVIVWLWERTFHLIIQPARLQNELGLLMVDLLLLLIALFVILWCWLNGESDISNTMTAFVNDIRRPLADSVIEDEIQSAPFALPTPAIWESRLLPQESGVTRGEIPCGICLEQPHVRKPHVLTSCKHFFCFDCLQKWETTQNRNSHVFNCPICRREFVNQKFFLFLND